MTLWGKRLYDENPDIENGGATPPKTFTQEEVDVIVAKRLNEERKKLNAEFETRLNEKVAELEQERDNIVPTLLEELGLENIEAIGELKNKANELNAEVEVYKQKEALQEKRNIVKGLGVHDDFIEYVVNSVSNGEYEEFVKNKPRILAENYITQSSNPSYVGGGKPNSEELLNTADSEAYIRARRAEEKGE